LLLFLAGAVQMPAMKAYTNMNNMPLFTWMQQVPFKVSWWLWASVAILTLLALNTFVCSLDSLIRKRHGRHWLLVASPQIIHLGFMFLLLAHLLSAAGGLKGEFYAGKGANLTLPGGGRISITEFKVETSKKGMPTNFYVDANFSSKDGKILKKARIMPNKPAFFEGMWFYIKGPHRTTAHMEVTRDFGLIPAFLGGVLFTIGTIALVWQKVRRER
jgi:cytochrome c biogenesis protein ResB